MSTPIYPQILGRRYPDLQWAMRGNDLNTLQTFNGSAPSQSVLDALWPGVETEINLENYSNSKEITLQIQYPLQTQIIELMKAQISNVNDKITEILNLWEVL